MRTFIDILWVLACALVTAGLFRLYPHVPTSPPPQPIPRMEDIPYCWSQQHGLYLPCRYSSARHNA